MKLWKISQTENDDYDTYDSAVVAAETVEEAKSIHPGVFEDETSEERWEKEAKSHFKSWASSRELVVAEYLGEAKPDTVSGIIVASFHAG